MGYKELIDALNRECEEKIRAIWQDTEAEAEKIRTDGLRKIAELRDKYNVLKSAAFKEKAGAILSDAKNRAGIIRLHSEKELSERLYNLSKESLAYLRDKQYKDVFGSIVKELPSYKWKTVKVNPADAEIAKTYFPDSEIIPDNAITGGVEVSDETGDVRIINTFEKRLEIAWQEMLLGLMEDIYRGVQGHGTSSKN